MSELLALPYTDRITDKCTKTIVFKGTELLLSDGYYQAVDSYTEITWNLSFSKLDETDLQEFLTYINLVLSTNSYVSWTPAGEAAGVYSINPTASSKYGKINREFNIVLIQKLGANYEPSVIVPTIEINHTTCSDYYYVTVVFPVEVPSFTYQYLITPYLIFDSVATTDNKTFVITYVGAVVTENKEDNVITFASFMLDGNIISYEQSNTYTVYSYLVIESILHRGDISDISISLPMPKTILPTDAENTVPYVPYVPLVDRNIPLALVLKVVFSFDKALQGLTETSIIIPVGEIVGFQVAADRKSVIVLVTYPFYLYSDVYNYVTIAFTGVTADIPTVLTCINKTNPNSPGFLIDTCPYVYSIVDATIEGINEKILKYRFESTGLIRVPCDFNFTEHPYGIKRSTNRNSLAVQFTDLPGMVAYTFIPDENFKLPFSYLSSGLSSSDYGLPTPGTEHYECFSLALSDDGMQVCFTGYNAPSTTTYTPYACVIIQPRIGSTPVYDTAVFGVYGLGSCEVVADGSAFYIPNSYVFLDRPDGTPDSYGMTAASYDFFENERSFSELQNGSELLGKFPGNNFGTLSATLFPPDNISGVPVQPSPVIIASHSSDTHNIDPETGYKNTNFYMYSLNGTMDAVLTLDVRLTFMQVVKGNWVGVGNFNPNLYLLYGRTEAGHVNAYVLSYSTIVPTVLTIDTTPYHSTSFTYPNDARFDITADRRFLILGIGAIYSLETKTMVLSEEGVESELNTSLGLVII